MSPDAYGYLAQAKSLAALEPAAGEKGSGRRPAGYPLALAGLLLVGARTETSFQLLNLAAIAGGLAVALRSLGRRGLTPGGQSVVALLFLVSLPVLEAMNVLLSDALFFVCAAATIELLERAHDAEGRRRRFLLVAAFAALSISVFVRAVGLALVPILLITALRGRKASRTGARRLALVATVVVAGLVVAAWLDQRVLKSRYLDEAQASFVDSLARQGAAAGLAGRGKTRLAITGQHVVNFELRAHRELEPAFVLAGLGGLTLLAGAIASGRERTRPVELFLAAYLPILFVYPAFDHRYWLPVLPYAFGLVGIWAGCRWSQHARFAAACLAVAFFVAGGWRWSEQLRRVAPRWGVPASLIGSPPPERALRGPAKPESSLPGEPPATRAEP